MTVMDVDLRDRRFALARDNPADFARLFLGTTPTDQQKFLFDAVRRPGAKVAVRSGHGVGKSTALAVCALWFLCTRKDAKIPCSAPTAHQLHDVLWPEMRRLAARAPRWMRDQIHISSDEVKRDGSAGMIAARTARPENPEALQGFHADNILFLLDEASGIHDAVFEVARGALSTPSARVVMTGNPTQLSGYFFNAFHGSRDGWTRLHFSCLDSPRVAENFPREIAAEYGEDSDMYRVRVLGEFPRSGIMAVIPADLADAAMARTLPRHFDNPAAKILGIDFALEGTDRTAVVMRRGVYASVIFSGRTARIEQLAALVADIIHRERPHSVFADKGGIGAPILQVLRGHGLAVDGVNFGDPPTDRSRFVRRRDEMWFRMREWFERDNPAVERNADLRSDLIGPEYGRNAAWKIQLESKESMKSRGLASPDLGDALALTFAMDVPPPDREAFAARRGETDAEYDPLGGH